jgi:hypothetical protein
MKEKLCPLKFLSDNAGDKCEGENCACYIKVTKPVLFANGIADPDFCYYFEGCGLLSIMPFEVIKKEFIGKNAKANS